jgi:hypothetical protein
MYDAFEKLHRNLRNEHSDKTDYEWLKIVKMKHIPHWLYGLREENAYVALDYEFHVQWSHDRSCWQYVSERLLCSCIYSAKKKPSLEHFRQWAVS